MNQRRINHSVWYVSLLLIIIYWGCDSQSLKGQNKVLAYWRFEQIVNPNLDSVAALKANQLLVAPLSYGYDETGRGNLLQWRGSTISPNVISNNVPVRLVNGQYNTSYLLLKNDEYIVALDRPLDYYDLQKNWTIEASLKCNWLWEEQVYLCKEGRGGQLAGDVSVGFDNTLQQYFVEVTCADGVARRVAAGDRVEAGRWYDVRAHAEYDQKENRTKLVIEVRPSGQKAFQESKFITFKGSALPLGASRWVIGRGYPGTSPNHLAVIDGGIDEVKISGEALPRVTGQNPLFTDAFTADPSTLVDGNTLYVYAGEDKATPGGWFDMPGWRCYSTTNMKHWAEHGTVLQAKDFQNAFSSASWASQVVKKDGKYYFYVTLDGKNGHFITVAVGDSPTGPFKEATPGKPLITDDMTKDSHRPNADIDPTIFIDDDGTPWMAWGNGDCYLVKLRKNMVELDGQIIHVPVRNYAEGPWLFKRGNLYYNVYAADAPGVQPEQICYATAPKITGPWSYRGYVTGHAKHGFTIHPAVVEFKGQWYFFYHDGAYSFKDTPGGDCRRQVCVEYLNFNPDGTIKPITITPEGVNGSPKR